MVASTPNWVFFGVTLFNLGLLLIWPVLSIITLLMMRKRRIADVAQAIWVLMVILIPILGALAYWIVKPGEPKLQGFNQ